MAELELQLGKIIIGARFVGKTYLLQHRPAKYTKTPINEYPSAEYIEGNNEVDARNELINNIARFVARPGILLLDDGLDITTHLQNLKLDYKLVGWTDDAIEQLSGATTKQKEDLFDQKQRWANDALIPARKRLDLEPGQHLLDVLDTIMEEPIIRDPGDDGDDALDGLVEEGDEDDRPHTTDNSIAENCRVLALPLSFSNIIVNSPYSQNKSGQGGLLGMFNRLPWLSKVFLLLNIVLSGVLLYALWGVSNTYQEFLDRDMEGKYQMLREPDTWTEDADMRMWMTLPRKLVSVAMPWFPRRRQVSEGLLELVESWVQAERFLRGSEPGEKYSDVLRRLHDQGVIY